MYSSVKEHRVCVNTSSSVCHMDSPAVRGRVSSKPDEGKEEVSFTVDWIALNNKGRHKKSRSRMLFAGLFRPQEWRLGMHTVTAWPMICQRWVQVGGFRACAECVTPLPRHFSILLFHVLFCLTDSSNGLRPSVCLWEWRADRAWRCSWLS